MIKRTSGFSMIAVAVVVAVLVAVGVVGFKVSAGQRLIDFSPEPPAVKLEPLPVADIKTEADLDVIGARMEKLDGESDARDEAEINGIVNGL